MRKFFLLFLSLCFMLSASLFSYADSWQCDNYGWWYQLSDGSYYKNDIVLINGRYYGFDKLGYIINGWDNSYDGKWRYFLPEGTMAQNVDIDGYYLGADGAMLTSAFRPDGFYADANGRIVVDNQSSMNVDYITGNYTCTKQGDGLDVFFYRLQFFSNKTFLWRRDTITHSMTRTGTYLYNYGNGNIILHFDDGSSQETCTYYNGIIHYNNMYLEPFGGESLITN